MVVFSGHFLLRNGENAVIVASDVSSVRLKKSSTGLGANRLHGGIGGGRLKLTLSSPGWG